MGNKLMRFYMAIREPKIFFVIVSGFITISLTAHVMRQYDADLGLTNLILSIEATLYGIVSSMMVKTVMRQQEAMAEMQRQQLEALISMAEAQRDMLADHATLLRALREGDERILKALTEGEKQ
jgi:hypothetical protein